MRTVAYVPAGTPVPAAATYLLPQFGLRNPTVLSVYVPFVYGSGGTTNKFFIQTSLDFGTTWKDIGCIAYTTASLAKTAIMTSGVLGVVGDFADGALADNTVVAGLLGSVFRIKNIVAGAYAASTYGIYLTYQPD